jgi:malonyl-CoA O-methyltransferase
MRIRLVAAAGWRRVRRRFGLARHHSAESEPASAYRPPPMRTLAWIRGQEAAGGGIKVAPDRLDAYPEVTGYLVPTLLQYGERALAIRCLRWLVSVQQQDGSYLSPEGWPMVFDTAQALRGLLAGIGLDPRASDCARRAAEFIDHDLRTRRPGGFVRRFLYRVPESVNLYALPPLRRAGSVLDRPEFFHTADTFLRDYLNDGHRFRPDILTHFLGYELEALIDLGHPSLAADLLRRIRREQRPDGSVPGVQGASWVCAPGLAQLAVCWYKTRQYSSANRALEWLETHQEPSGGFLGGYGHGSSYFPEEEVPWAAKFYLDANLLRIRSFFDESTFIVPRSVHDSDGRAQTVLSSVMPRAKILEVGCGKGRYLRLIRKHFPDVECSGLDLTKKTLEELPRDTGRINGSMDLLPCRDESFDFVFAIEAVEHSQNLANAMREILRVARPGGTILVIDKPGSEWGRLDCPPWEYWPGEQELVQLLRSECVDVETWMVPFDGDAGLQGLMRAWRARKDPSRHRLGDPGVDASLYVGDRSRGREIAPHES